MESDAVSPAIAGGAKRSVAAKASSSNGRMVWLIANGRSVRSRSCCHWASSSGTVRTAVPSAPSPPASHTVSANSTTTLTGTFGCLVYDDTLAAVVVDQGMCYNYFGGTQSVTSGTFTIQWAATGILFLTL